MILAAGFGARLRPITDSIPKVLVPVLGVPLLERLVAFLLREGATELALNSHYMAEAVAGHAEKMSTARPAQPRLRIFHERELLGTGGGVLNAAPFWGGQPLLVWNGDIVAELEPGELWRAHQREGPLATLATQQRAGSSHLQVDEAGFVCGIDSPRRGDKRVVREPRGRLRRAAFNGISVLAPQLREGLEPGGSFDLIDALLEAIASGAHVRAFDCGEGFWGTTGSPERLADLEKALGERPDLLAKWTPPRAPQP